MKHYKDLTKEEKAKLKKIVKLYTELEEENKEICKEMMGIAAETMPDDYEEIK